MSAQIGHLDRESALAGLRPWAQPAPPISGDEYQARIERARALMRAQGVDALLVGAGASLRYFAGVPWGARAPGGVADGQRRSAAGVPGVRRLARRGAAGAGRQAAVEEHEDPHALVAQAMAERGARSLALDPAAAFAVHTGLRAHLDASAIVDAAAIIDGCRARKSAAELALMQQACDMTLQVQRLAAGIAREGIGTDELVRFIDQAHRALGADNGSTFCIVQFGHATAYPHGIPGVQHLREGDLVLIDTGCTVQGYHADITRTWVFGRASDEQKRIWDLEHAAQAAAFAAVRPGVACEDVDAAARRVLEAAGLGPDYRLPGLPHRTGHGCGLAIHEAPYLVRGNRTALEPGMCASNEPMIVVPGGSACA